MSPSRLAVLLLLILLDISWAWSSRTLTRGSTSRKVVERRELFVAALVLVTPSVAAAAAYSGPKIDVNNAMAREFTAFPGLFPTIATKIVKGQPYSSKQQVYQVLDSDLERERLKQYDAAIIIQKPDKALQQFKASQICKYECGSRVSNSYRDEQIKAVQQERLYK